ncbi:hypothetical protein BC332_23427 [Capsicum chinense]|nr:hypothetical protein BC332_23427 [Capsicum chinense]
MGLASSSHKSGWLMKILSGLRADGEEGKKRVASATAANMCKKLPSDASDFVMEVVPLLMNLLQYNDAKVGDAGTILDVMAVMLENITSIQVVERTTIDVVYRASQIIASMPNLSYQNKLLPVMVHPDYETRVGAHRIFSVILVPSCVSPQKVSEETRLRQQIFQEHSLELFFSSLLRLLFSES